MTQRTNLGNIILGIMKDTNSVSAIISYFDKNHLFESFQAPCNRTRALYEYQIREETWNELTGITLGQSTTIEMKDGALYKDCYFDADYRDNTLGQYIYLSIDPENIAIG